MSTDTNKKLLVVAVAALVFVPIVVWRSVRAASTESSGDWGAFIKEDMQRKAPSWYSPPLLLREPHEPAGPHLKLGTLRFQQRVAHAKQTMADERLMFPPIYARARALGSSYLVMDAVDENVPGLPEGAGEVVHSLYLLHAGRIPPKWRKGSAQLVCQAVKVFPGRIAAAAGMRAGDVFAAVNDTPVTEGQNPCDTLVDALARVADGATARLIVLRDGAEVPLSMTRQGPKFGYAYQAVPVLDETEL